MAAGAAVGLKCAPAALLSGFRTGREQKWPRRGAGEPESRAAGQPGIGARRGRGSARGAAGRSETGPCETGPCETRSDAARRGEAKAGVTHDSGQLDGAAAAPHLALLLPHLRIGGVEKSLVSLVDPLRAHGWRVTVIAQSPDGVLGARLEALVPLPGRADLGGRRVIGASARLAGLMRRARFDLIYSATNDTNLLSLIARMRARRPEIACVISEHTPVNPWIAEHKLPRLRRAAMRLLYPRAQAFCAPSAGIGDEIAALLGERTPPVHVLPNAVIDVIPPWRPLAARAARLVSIGRLRPEKRFDLMIRAFARLHAAHPSVRLTIHGEGPERPALEALCRALGLAGAVHLPGETRDVAAALARADGFLCTSLREGLGNAIIEAQAAGVPVLSVDCPFGPRQLLRGGRAGLLVGGDDVAALAAALFRFHRDRAAREAWRRAARAVARSYSVERAAEAHDRLFRLCLKEHRARWPVRAQEREARCA
ncbi:MAG: hypothetical protein Kow0058_03610 [Roseovarius sp.]